VEQIATINDLGDAETDARLMRYETAHERCAGSGVVDDDQLVANGDRLEVFAARNPSVVPRGPLGVDFVLERTSRYNAR
jgi:glyceraldehyde 3-phosphate dehydrogenase